MLHILYKVVSELAIDPKPRKKKKWSPNKVMY